MRAIARPMCAALVSCSPPIPVGSLPHTMAAPPTGTTDSATPATDGSELEPTRLLQPSVPGEPTYGYVVLIEGSLGWTGDGLSSFADADGPAPSELLFFVHDDWFLATGDPEHACRVEWTVEGSTSATAPHPDLHRAVSMTTEGLSTDCPEEVADRLASALTGLGVSDFVGTEADTVGIEVPISPLFAQALWLQIDDEWLPVGYFVRLQTTDDLLLTTDGAGRPLLVPAGPGSTGPGVLRASGLTRFPLP